MIESGSLAGAIGWMNSPANVAAVSRQRLECSECAMEFHSSLLPLSDDSRYTFWHAYLACACQPDG